MKKYKLLHVGHFYINKTGDFAIALLGGNKKHGYRFQVSHTCRNFSPVRINIQSRIVLNDDYWWELPPQEYANVVYNHGEGRPVELVGV
jgi:hypothetical protein